MLRPLDRFCSSLASLTRCASPPDRVVAGWPEPDVAQPDLGERAQVAGDRRDGGEEVGRLLDRHVEDLGDGLALVVHLEGLPVEPGPVADLAGHVHVGQEVHLDLQRAVARARLAAPALDVEREAAGQVPAHLRLGRAGEQLADVVPHPGVGGRVRPGGPADRRLVDVHDLVEVLEAGDRPVPARHHARTVQLVGQRRVEDVVDQAGLARPGHPGDGHEAARAGT